MPPPDTTNIQWRSRVRLVDEVVEVLRSEIYAGRFPSGTPLLQEQLAASSGSSPVGASA